MALDASPCLLVGMLILGLDWFCLNTSLNLDPACYFLPESPFLMGMGVVLSSLPIKEMAFSCYWGISRWRRVLYSHSENGSHMVPSGIHYQLRTGTSCGHGRRASEGCGCYLKANAFRDVASKTFKNSTMNRHRILIPGWFQPFPRLPFLKPPLTVHALYQHKLLLKWMVTFNGASCYCRFQQEKMMSWHMTILKVCSENQGVVS